MRMYGGGWRQSTWRLNPRRTVLMLKEEAGRALPVTRQRAQLGSWGPDEEETEREEAARASLRRGPLFTDENLTMGG